METRKAYLGASVAILLAGGAFCIAGYPQLRFTEQAIARPAHQKTEAKQSLDQTMKSLRAVDVAYASGNAAEARTRFEEARSSWDKVAPTISAREAREAQLMFESLDNQLKSGVPATKVKSTVHGMLAELREDIERELR
jgi:hypothetical protein